MNNKKKIITMISAIFLLVLLIIGGSRAYFSWNSNTNKNVIFNTSSNLKNYIVYDEGESKFVGDLQVSSNYYSGMHSTITISKKSEAANLNLLATIHMDVNQIGENMKKSSALKWVVTKGTSSNNQGVLAQGNFIGSKNGDVLTLVPNIEVTTTETFYTIWIWLDASENPSDLLSGETLDTNVWTEINQLEGTEDRYEITRINANYQTINATVVDNKYKVTNYAVTTSNTTPSTWENIAQANQSNVYNLTHTVSETGTYYVWFKDSNNRTTSKSIQVTTLDNTPPTCTWGSFSPVQIANNETSSITLTCTDTESELSINNLTTESITKSNNNVTVTNVTKTSVTNGYKYTVTVKGTETDGTTTLTLPANSVKNALGLGNVVKTSDPITVSKTYTVALNKNGGTGGTSTIYGKYNDGVYLDSARTNQKMTTNGNPITVPTKTGYNFMGYADVSGTTSNLSLGDYVSYTPTKTSYTTDTSKTGYTSIQTINPSELTLWRVLSINGDGTVDLISENVSSTYVYFSGQTGYQNLVGYLNVLASQYETSGITVGSRHFGYNGQTQYITDTSKFINTAPWTCTTGGSCNPVESQGGGDELYLNDYNLVNTVLGTRVATKPNGDSSVYWMASRKYSYYSTTYYNWNGRYVDTSGSVSSNPLYYYYDSSFLTYSNRNAFRPIVTLKSGLVFSEGNGLSSTPWIIDNPIYLIDSNGYKTNDFEAENISEDMTLDAVWTPTNYTITYNLDGGEQTNPKTTYTIEDDNFTLVNPTKEGYMFTGWTGSNGSTPQTTVTINQGSTGNKTYTANWTSAGYTLSFSNSGGTGTPSTMTATDGSSHIFTLPSTPIPSKGSANFIGWGINSSDSNVEYPVSGFVYPSLAPSTNDSTHPWTEVNGGYKSNIQGINSGTTNLEYTFTLTSSDTLSFEWSVSSESASYDYLYYSIYQDGSTTAMSGTGTSTKIGGTTYGTTDAGMNYLTVSKTLTAGSYRLVFTYRKDSSVDKGTDAGYVRNVKAGNSSTPLGVSYSPSEVTLTHPNTSLTLYAKYGTEYKAEIYYNVGTTIEKETLSCYAIDGFSTTCNVTIPDSVKNSIGRYNTTYLGLSNSLSSMTQTINSSATTITLSGNSTYYAIYQGNVTEYLKGTSRTIYRNSYMTSTSAYTTVLSTTTTGTSNLSTESYTCESQTCAWYGYATSSTSGTRSYSSVSSAATVNVNTLYTLYTINANVTFYYYNGSQQATTTATGYRIMNYQGSFIQYTSLSVPSTVSGSKGPNDIPYIGVSTLPSSTTTTTTITPATANYYAVYGGNYTASFVKGNNVSAIGSTQLSCQGSYTTNGTSYSGTDCSITLPTITVTNGNIIFGWFKGAGLIGQPSETIYLTENVTLTAEGGILEAREFLYNNSNTGVNCMDVQCMLDYLADGDESNQTLSLGDYVSYTPTKTSYTTDTSMTGYTSTQTINPSELTLWRVISKNADGTVDLISENISSTNVYFRGQTGYQNFVGYLNTLASQYETSGITIGSRHFGYNGQTQYITDTSKFVNPAPWTCSTGGSCNPVESQGGGDTLYLNDYNLVNTVLGTRVATKPNGGSSTYWMASRYYNYYSASSYYWYGRSVSTSGSVSNNYLYIYNSSSFDARSNSYALRPIVTLKSGLSYSGNGTQANPWTIN